MIELNENIFHLYNKWKEGYTRKENGKKYTTVFGDVFLHRLDYDKSFLDKMFNGILDKFFDDNAFEIGNIHNYEHSKEFLDEVKNDESPFIYLIANYRVGTCMYFAEYEDLVEWGSIDSDEISEEDYIAILKLIVNYIRDNNISIEYDKNAKEYKIVLFSGYIEDDEEDEDGGYMTPNDKYDEIEENFPEEFNETEISSWSYGNETNIGVDVDMYDLLRYKKMKEYIDGIIGNE